MSHSVIQQIQNVIRLIRDRKNVHKKTLAEECVAGSHSPLC